MALFSSSSELLNWEFVDYTCSFEYLSILWLETNCTFIKLRQLILNYDEQEISLAIFCILSIFYARIAYCSNAVFQT